ncbi:lytic transglycosylase domain-containing protein [Cnuibacter sp. UC19_7]|uniref:lytic transglycosylase domain-containing protein n=1 Tax=Cnuibacter sp. UC19_7 TaxID=3350166 RepID=UPI00366A606A
MRATVVAAIAAFAALGVSLAVGAAGHADAVTGGAAFGLPQNAVPTRGAPVGTAPSEIVVTGGGSARVQAGGLPAGGLAAAVDAGWAATTAARAGIPTRAMIAYAGAALVLATEQPDCGLGWNTLAALGDVESDHGRHGGSTVGGDGAVEPPIIGPSLDGGAFASIGDSDGGVWDDDATWDHAVGPFQFIPDTWRAWGTDAGGDGHADPQNIDDSALAAARYLCASGSLASAQGWRAAVFSYNHDDAYVDRVAAVANGYADRTS